jgi:hypothetical protein
MDKWQPIETAPRNEGDLLLWADRVVIGYFSSVSGHWLSRDGRYFNDRPKQLEPSHWMPMPISPAYNHSGRSNPHRNLKGIDIRLTRLEKTVRRILILMMILAVVVLPGWAPVAPVQVPVTKPLGLSSISLGDLT